MPFSCLIWGIVYATKMGKQLRSLLLHPKPLSAGKEHIPFGKQSHNYGTYHHSPWENHLQMAMVNSKLFDITRGFNKKWDEDPQWPPFLALCHRSRAVIRAYLPSRMETSGGDPEQVDAKDIEVQVRCLDGEGRLGNSGGFAVSFRDKKILWDGGIWRIFENYWNRQDHEDKNRWHFYQEDKKWWFKWPNGA